MSHLVSLKVHISDDSGEPEGAVQEYMGYNNDLDHNWRGPYAYIVAEWGNGHPVRPTVHLSADNDMANNTMCGPDYAAGTSGWYRYVYGDPWQARPVTRIRLYRGPAERTTEQLAQIIGYKHSSVNLNMQREISVNEDVPGGIHLYLM